MVRAGDDAGLDPFGDPNLIDEVADLGMHFQQIAGLHVEVLGVLEFNHSGLRLEISYSHLALPERV